MSGKRRMGEAVRFILVVQYEFVELRECTNHWTAGDRNCIFSFLCLAIFPAMIPVIRALFASGRLGRLSVRGSLLPLGNTVG